ncbi:MAG: flagellar hook-basal body complex protein [bacterium]|nr:flagellar hook-basal body complex protein [bacterium]
MALISLFTGLSGIQAHQTRTNVVADNIANINTVGFKSRRANFEELLAQTSKEATGPEGNLSGTNPVQAGIGVQLKSIDTTFTQGSLQITGRDTDLAIEGDGFFILSDGVNRFYTRDGAFTFDALGKLINPSNGMGVQGNIADSTGRFGATTGLENVQLDLNREIPGVSTTRVNLSGNIDPGPVSALTTGTEFVTASVVSGGPGFPFTLATEQKLEMRIDSPDGLTSGSITVPDASYLTLDSFVDGINAAIAGNDRLAGKVIAQQDPNTPGNIQLRTTVGGTGVQLTLNNVGTGTALATLGLGATGSNSAIATTGSTLNSLAQVGTALNAGDILRFSGSRADGTSYNGTFTAAAGSTIQNFLDTVSAAFGDNVSGGLDLTGKIQLTDSSGNAVTGFTVDITLDDQGAGSGLVGDTGLQQHKISTNIFDSQGRSHTMNINLAESPVANKWTYTVKIDNQTPNTGGTGTVTFDEDGSIRTFTPTEGEGTLLQFTPSGEVLPMKIDFTGLTSPERGINGLTQFSSPGTADVVDQNGRSAGRLDTIFIQNSGVVEGRFTNGETLNLARVNLANFDNPGGLLRVGGNLFAETENTGPPLIEIATETIESQIAAGSLELSNVDLAQEFTDLIISQRGFQANARVVTTTDQILAETVNLKQ